MAYTSKSFLRDLAIYSTGAVVGPKNTAKFVAYAGKKGIQLAGVGAARAAPAVAGAAVANPITAGTLLGLGALATPPGQALLQSAEERGAADRIRAQQAVDLWVYENITRPAQMATDVATSPQFASGVRTKARKKVSKYNKAVKAGMSAVKASKFSGKKGTISNAKTAFKAVNRVASAVNRGKKVSAKGVTGTIARAVRKIL